MFLKLFPATTIPIFLVVSFMLWIIPTTANLPSQVVHLTDETFDATMSSSGDPWLIEFYAPWCSACRGFEPKFAEAANILALEGNTRLAKINVDESPGLSNRFMINRLPTLYFIQNKEVRLVKMRQETSSIVNFMKTESWRDSAIWSGLFSPFSIIGRTFGYLGTSIGFLVKNRMIVIGVIFALAAMYLGQSIWGNWKAATMVQNSPVVDAAALKKNE